MAGFSPNSETFTSRPTVEDLESIDTVAMRPGELAVVQNTGIYYYLDRANVQVRDGVNILYIRETNPTYGATGLAVGRWVKACIPCTTATGSIGS